MSTITKYTYYDSSGEVNAPQYLVFSSIGVFFLSNITTGTVLQISTTGQISPFLSGLLSPTGITIASGIFYVSTTDGSDKNIYSCSVSNPSSYLVYTCPYHPRLNSIEQFFNQMKHYIKLDKPNTFTELEKSVKISINKIKEENYKNYFIYAYNKDYYKNKTNKRKYNKRRTLKIYKN